MVIVETEDISKDNQFKRRNVIQYTRVSNTPGQIPVNLPVTNSEKS